MTTSHSSRDDASEAEIQATRAIEELLGIKIPPWQRRILALVMRNERLEDITARIRR